jgi:hypothetical protein
MVSSRNSLSRGTDIIDLASKSSWYVTFCRTGFRMTSSSQNIHSAPRSKRRRKIMANTRACMPQRPHRRPKNPLGKRVRTIINGIENQTAARFPLNRISEMTAAIGEKTRSPFETVRNAGKPP